MSFASLILFAFNGFCGLFVVFNETLAENNDSYFSIVCLFIFYLVKNVIFIFICHYYHHHQQIICGFSYQKIVREIVKKYMRRNSKCSSFSIRRRAFYGINSQSCSKVEVLEAFFFLFGVEKYNGNDVLLSCRHEVKTKI